MRKIWTIISLDVYTTFTDRSLLLLMFVTPLALATIIALAFGDIASGSGAPIRDIPVALVNLDEGDNGQIFVDLLTPAQNGDAERPSPALDCGDETPTATNADNTLLALTDTVLVADAETARRQVDNGRYAAAIIIPPDFSAGLEFTPQNMNVSPPPVEVYTDLNRPISADVIRAVTQGIVNQMLLGQIAIAATYQTLFDEGMAAQSAALDPCVFAPAFASDAYTVGIAQQSIAESDEPLNLLVIFGAAQAVFFSLFTASGSAAAILEDRRNGTLQRLMVTPTPRWQILIGKLMSTFANVLLQLVFLFIAFVGVASVLEGELMLIWGTNWPLIALMVLVLSLAAASIGMIITALAKTAEQANIVGSVIALFMGAAGGAFFQIGELPPLFEAITRLSIVRWGERAFSTLASGGSDIWLDAAAMGLIGAAFFAVSAFIFLRREDV